MSKLVDRIYSRVTNDLGKLPDFLDSTFQDVSRIVDQDIDGPVCLHSFGHNGFNVIVPSVDIKGQCQGAYFLQAL
jgi:hypothetical protein